MSEWKIRCEYTRLVPIEDLRPHPKNPKKHSKEAIERQALVMEYQGWRRPITVSNRSGNMTAGHKRLYAAKSKGITEVPVSFQDYDSEEQEISDMIADNALNEWELTDLAAVNDLSGDLGPDFDIDLLGIKDFTIDVADKHGDEDADAVPEPPKEAKSKTGDLWLLGNHRVLCGDSTKREDVERLMAGEKADMVFTDPPYGIGYEYNSHDDSSSQDNSQLVAAALLAHDCGKVWTPGKMNIERDISRFGKAKLAIWYKKFAQAGSGLGGASTFEPILVLDPKEKKLPNDVLVVSTEREELNGQSLRELHSCPKPVELYVQLLNAFSVPGDRIAEPFCGSGTTLIACEKTNRRCFGSEIDPHYCDVIVQRWEKFTGKTAYLIEDANGELPSGPVSYADLCSMRSKTSKSESKSIVQ